MDKDALTARSFVRHVVHLVYSILMTAGRVQEKPSLCHAIDQPKRSQKQVL